MTFDILGTFREGLEVIIHPNKEARTNLGVKDAAVMYYKFAVVPIIFAIVASLVILAVLPGVLASLPSTQLLNGSLSLTMAAYEESFVGLIITPLFIPIALLVIAGLIHGVGKVLRLLKGSFSKTFTAVVYAEFASLLFWFAIALGNFGSIIFLLAAVYGVYMLVVVLAKEHKTSATNAFVAGLIVFILLVIVATALLSGYFAALQASGALPPS